MTTYTLPAPSWLHADNLGAVVEALAAKGITAELSLRSDGLVHIDSETDPTAIWKALRAPVDPNVAAMATLDTAIAALAAKPARTPVEEAVLILGRLRKEGR